MVLNSLLTLAAFVVVLTTARPRPLLPTKRCHYALPSTPSCRDSEAQSTRRRRHRVVDLTAPTTCRRLRHLTDDAVLTPRREPSLRLLPARPLLTAGSHAAGLHLLNCLLKLIIVFLFDSFSPGRLPRLETPAINLFMFCLYCY